LNNFQCHDIQVIFPTAYKAESDKLLEEMTTYTLSNFQVLPNDLFFKASYHKYKLKWTGGTTVVDPNVHDIPDADLKFKQFAEILARKWCSNLLVRKYLNFIYISMTILLSIIIYLFIFWLDVIGYVHEIGYCQVNQRTSKKLQVNSLLKDLRYNLQYCATIHHLIPFSLEKD